jgi:hypothetical protein
MPNTTQFVLVGSFDLQLLRFDIDSLQEIQFSKKIIANYDRSLYLFRLDTDRNAAFYVTNNSKLNAVTFDDAGKVLRQLLNIFPGSKIVSINVSMSNEKYLISAYLKHGKSTLTGRFRNQEICFPQSSEIQSVTLFLDERTNCVKHVAHEDLIWTSAANNSNIILVKRDDTFLFYDSELNVAKERSLERIEQQIDEEFLDMVLNDQNIFI